MSLDRPIRIFFYHPTGTEHWVGCFKYKLAPNVSVSYLKRRGMRTNLQRLREPVSCSCFCYDIIMIGETWLIPDNSDVEIGIENFIIYRHDRIAGQSSAVLLRQRKVNIHM